MAVGGGGISTGGGTGGRRGGGGGSAANARQTHISWFEAELKTPAAITGSDGAEKETEADALRRMLGMSEWDPKPVLLYFHTAHDGEGDAGKPWATQCKQIDNEKVARWSGLYHFVEVDMAKSEKKLLERFGATNGPSFAIVNQDLEVVTTSATIGSAKKFAGFLQSTVKKHFVEYWAEIQVRLDEQKDALKEAKSLEKKKDITGAVMRVREVTRSALRIGPFWDDAVKMDKKLTRKMTDGG